MKACEEGILAGYRVVDVKIDFYDGKMHPVDSKDIAFQIAGYFASRNPFLAARPCLLEPIHRSKSAFPKIAWAKSWATFQPPRQNSRHGHGRHVPGDQSPRPGQRTLSLLQHPRSLTGGRGVHTEDFSHYEEMPREAEQRVVEESKKARLQQAE